MRVDSDSLGLELLTTLAVLSLAPDAIEAAHGGAPAVLAWELFLRRTNIFPRTLQAVLPRGSPIPALSCPPHSHSQQRHPPSLSPFSLRTVATATRIPCRRPRHAPQRPVSFYKLMQYNTQGSRCLTHSQAHTLSLSLSCLLSLSRARVRAISLCRGRARGPSRSLRQL